MPHARGFTHTISGQIHVREPERDDEAIARLAERQHGVAARQQLVELGIRERRIDHRLAVGRLWPVHPGVYAVGHAAVSFRGRALAAVISTAPGAATSHPSAEVLWGLAEPRPSPIHVTVADARRPRPGVVVHRGILPPEEVTIRDGIPVTTVPRLLLDRSQSADRATLRRLLKDAEFRGLTDVAAVAGILARHPRRRGRRTLASIVDELVAGTPTRSELEDRFLAFCGRRGLPAPETNVLLELRGRRYEVDCAFRAARLVVELDGRRAHRTSPAFDDDRERDRILLAAGWSTIRVTWAHLHRSPDALAADLRCALATDER